LKLLVQKHKKIKVMKDLKDVYIKSFRNKESQKHPMRVSLFDWVTSDSYKDSVLQLRAEPDEARRAQLKSALPCAMPSLLFDGGHSGFIALDIDGSNHGSGNDLSPQELKQKVCSIANVAYCGYSASGLGVWALVPILDGTKHLPQFKALVERFGQHGLVVDKACSNINRLRFASYDSEPYINEDASVFRLAKIESEKPKVSIKHESIQRDANIFDEFNQKANVVGLLTNHGWQVSKQTGSKIYLCRPGKSGSISGEFCTQRRLFYCFTSGAQFEPQRAYNASQLLSILECNEDMKRTATEIKRLFNL